MQRPNMTITGHANQGPIDFSRGANKNSQFLITNLPSAAISLAGNSPGKLRDISGNGTEGNLGAKVRAAGIKGKFITGNMKTAGQEDYFPYAVKLPGRSPEVIPGYVASSVMERGRACEIEIIFLTIRSPDPPPL